MTRDEFQAVYERGPDTTFALLQNLQQTLAALWARVKELEDRLAKDSHNSSKPPSSDGLKKKPKSLRQKSGNTPGGQPGHPGTTLCLVDEPDQITVHSPAACCYCGACLEPVPPTGFKRRQVHDLPPLCLHVSEHRALCKRCPACQALNRACFPAAVSRPVQYGPNLKALCVYLQQYQLLPFERTSELLSDLLGTSLSQGTLATMLATCQERLDPVEAAIKAAITEAPIADLDETGTRIDGKLHWLHTASTQELTFYAHHDRRGKAALDAIGVLPAFGGTAIHDAFCSYLGYDDCAHALCNAHLLRDLIALKEQSGQPWTGKMIALLLAIKQAVDMTKAQGGTHLSSACLNDFEARYQALVAQGFLANPAPPASGKRGRPKPSAAKNLLDRLDAHRALVLAFLYPFWVPFDNHLAERDLRMAKVRQKVSGGFRSGEGAALFCRIRGYISTLRKQGCHILPALQSVFEGNPFVPALRA
jgi:transposase